MSIPTYAAHSPGAHQPLWEDQRTHRERVLAALRAAGHHYPLAAGVAVLHDLGKYHPDFQAYIRASHAGEAALSAPHAFHGAVIAARLALGWPGARRPRHLGVALAAAPILAHHTGLTDHQNLRKHLENLEHQRAAGEALSIADGDGHPSVADLGSLFVPPAHLDLFDGTQVDLAIRMLTSQLVDADWTATEQHYRPHIAARRVSVPVSTVVARFPGGRTTFLNAQLARKARPPSAVVQRVRAEVYEACVRAGRTAAASGQTLFRLTVPTGGGKTISALAFAFALAEARAARPDSAPVSRVIMAVPLTSITDQNAEVARQVCGPDAVLEHHSNLDDLRRAQTPLHLRLAVENWDAPVIVTTTVQAIEALGAAEPRRLRKLHRLRNSVLILDEVQALPHHLLSPITSLLQEAATRYGVTVVLCSATQPQFELEARLNLTAAQEINVEYREHFAALKRVTYHWLGELTSMALTTRLLGAKQVLAVFNTRREAIRALQAAGPNPAHLHLSTLMCPAHRRDVRTQVDARLRAGQAVRLFSTTVVEAGVELSFPVTYRQTAGLERVIQVAGRTNRDGEGTGDVFIFDLCGGWDGQGSYGVATRTARRILLDLHARPDSFSDALHDPDTMHGYFQALLHDKALNLDAAGIQAERRQLNLRTVSDRFRLIDEAQVPVLIPYGRRAERLIAALVRKLHREEPLTPADRQRLQPFTVQVREADAARLGLTALNESLYVCPPNLYDPIIGLRLYDAI